MTIQREPPPSTTPPAILRKPFRWNPGGLQTEFADQPAAFDTLTLTGDLRLNGEIYIDDIQVTPFTPGDTTADYLVGTSQAALSNEIVVGATPGGELGGTWASPTVDATHAGSTHISTAIDFLVGTATGDLSAEIVVGTAPGGELGGTWASPTVDATHSGSAHHSHTITDVAAAARNSASQDSTTTTLANATGIALTVVDTAAYYIKLKAAFSGVTTTGLKWNFTSPGAATGTYTYTIVNSGVAAVIEEAAAASAWESEVELAAAEFGVDGVILFIEGVLIAAGSGSHQFQFARSDAAGTLTLLANQVIFFVRIS